MSDYGYESPIEITPEHVLQKITQEQIFEFVLKENFNWTSRYKSPFREHKDRGTCRFEQREDGTILFVDFGDLLGRTHRSCWRMLMDKERCNLTTAIKIVCEAFGLPTTLSEYKDVVIQTINYEKRDQQTVPKATISFVAKDFNRSDIQFWSQYLIRPEHLIEDDVFSVKRYTLIKDGKTLTFNPYKHCYAIDFITGVNIYQPYQKENKHIKSTNENHIGNIDKLPRQGNELIITKSYKDHRVLRNTIPELNVAWFQNEGCTPSEEVANIIINRFKLLTFFYDNDAPGIASALRVAEYFNAIRTGCARVVYIPEEIMHKDPSDFINKEGRKDLTELLKYILYA